MTQPNIRVLVIDDNPDDRMLYRRALLSEADAPIDIIECEDGENGLKEAVRREPDCILLDYSLPGRNGIEVLKRLRLFAPFMPVVMLTGQGNEALAVNAIREGAQSYVSKASVSAENLRRTIRLSIEHAALEKRILEQKQALEIFTRAMAHDLKEPIRTIRSFLQILENPDLPESKAKEYRCFVQKAAQKMESLIESVYNLLRAESIAPMDHPVSCQIQEAVGIAKDNLHALIQERGAVIETGPLDTCAIEVDHLARVLQNLFSNAIQHTTKQAPLIRVSSRTTPTEVLIDIADNGPGIPHEHHAKLFQPFAKISLNPQNLGLGLSICKRIIESYKGTISFTSEENRGTTFTLALPLSPFEQTPSKPAEIYKLAEDGQSPRAARILLIDDSVADIELARYAMSEVSSANCAMDAVTSGHDGIERMIKAAREGTPYDLVLLDINMPGLDGFETVAEIRNKDEIKNTPVFMCTTSTYEGDRSKAFQMGATDYIVKPITASDFLHVADKIHGLAVFART